ncbi:MAG: hypothetical protein IT385_18760 [Deltaproteobacteria bacterium]|nr:hypothetical protein [Deltaproteobacteria bacterium]
MRREAALVLAALALGANGATARGDPGSGGVIGKGSEVRIERADGTERFAGPYVGQTCVAVTELWPSARAGDLHGGRLRCGDDAFTATAVGLRVVRPRGVPEDGRFEGEALLPGARVDVLQVRDLATPPLDAGQRCVIAERPARRVGPGHLEGVLVCGGTRHEASAVAVRLAPEDAAHELSSKAPELGCAEGRWRDCALAGGRRLDKADGPMLDRACQAADPHACRDFGRWVQAYRSGETLRELELQERACILGSRLACFEHARARNRPEHMLAWCNEGFAPACRFLQLLHTGNKKESDRWRTKACVADPGCGSY